MAPGFGFWDKDKDPVVDYENWFLFFIVYGLAWVSELGQILYTFYGIEGELNYVQIYIKSFKFFDFLELIKVKPDE